MKLNGLHITRGKKMIYKNYTIEKLARRGIYQVIDGNKNIICVMPLLKDCKKIVDARIKVGA
jgi:hypothetical protein